MWIRYNTVSRLYEYSTNNGASFAQLPIDASILTHGSVPDARLSSNVPLINAGVNIFTGNQRIASANPALQLSETDQGVGLKNWDILAQSQLIFFRVLDDSFNGVSSPFIINRAGDAAIARDLNIGRGIQFPATQVPSTDVNCLDDYEEGDWTPVFGGSTSESGQTYTSRIGKYVKIGQQVWASAEIQASNLGVITGNTQIKGLPFQVGATGAHRGWFKGFWANTTTAFVFLTAVAEVGSTVATMYGATAATTGLGGLAAASFANTLVLVMDVTYRAAS